MGMQGMGMQGMGAQAGMGGQQNPSMGYTGMGMQQQTPMPVGMQQLNQPQVPASQTTPAAPTGAAGHAAAMNNIMDSLNLGGAAPSGPAFPPSPKNEKPAAAPVAGSLTEI